MSGNPAPCKVYYFRHGETEWAKLGATPDAPTFRSRSPARRRRDALAPRLASVNFTRVFMSPRLRARQTCELAGLSANAEVDDELAEWDYGEYEGLRSVEIRAHRPGWEIFRDGCPGGELPEEIVRRVDRAIHRLRALSGNVAVFSHGHFGRVFGVRWLNMSIRQARHFALSPASLSILGSDPARDEVEMMLCWNAVG